MILPNPIVNTHSVLVNKVIQLKKEPEQQVKLYIYLNL